MPNSDKSIQEVSGLRASLIGATVKSSNALIALGIVFCLLGVCGLIWQIALTRIAINAIGWVLIVGGVCQFAYAIGTAGLKNAILQIIFACIYGVAGVSILLFPVPAIEVLTLWLAFAFLISGILRLFIAFQYRQVNGWHWQLISAAISILIAILVLNSYPEIGLWLPGFLISFELLLQGWSLVFVGMAANKVIKNEKLTHQENVKITDLND